MSEELYVDGLGLAPGVMETIVAIAAKEVEALPALARLRSRACVPASPQSRLARVSM